MIHASSTGLGLNPRNPLACEAPDIESKQWASRHKLKWPIQLVSQQPEGIGKNTLQPISCEPVALCGPAAAHAPLSARCWQLRCPSRAAAAAATSSLQATARTERHSVWRLLPNRRPTDAILLQSCSVLFRCWFSGFSAGPCSTSDRGRDLVLWISVIGRKGLRIQVAVQRGQTAPNRIAICD